jgi:hypothetical protein
LKKAITKSKRAKKRPLPPPEIYVLGINEPGFFAGPRYCKAHLCFKKGFLYLQWKDNGKVRSFYLRKTPKVSPTASSSSSPAMPGPGARSGRRGTTLRVGEGKRRTRKGTKG